MNAIVKRYAKRIIMREILINDVPELWRKEVIKYLESLNGGN